MILLIVALRRGLKNRINKGKSGGDPTFFKKMAIFLKKVLTNRFGRGIIYELSARQQHARLSKPHD